MTGSNPSRRATSRDYPEAAEDEGRHHGNDDEPGDGDSDVEGAGGYNFNFVDGDGDEVDPAELEALFSASMRAGILTRQQFIALLLGSEAGAELRPPKDPNRFPKVPSEEGTKLMRSGVFGGNDHDQPWTEPQVARRMLDREIGMGDRERRGQNSQMSTQGLIPGTQADKIIHYDEPIYSGQFSDDGNFFFSCCQDFSIRMYDTSNPYNWKPSKTVTYPWGQGTLTDASLSPDNRWMAYTTVQSMVAMSSTDPNDTSEPYTMELDPGRNAPRGPSSRIGNLFGIWSVKFSGDGRELVAGTTANSIVIYDIESRKVLHQVVGHEDEVNAVSFADKSSPHIIYSGSDDTTIKVWDRRSMGDGREAGAFVGHIEGVAYIDSKDDGQYILSNGKDQSMKLWDLRMVMSTNRFRETNRGHRPRERFNYRADDYDESEWDVHPHDNSLVTFRGHSVARTLIRCHFSPPSATNCRYVYSGSADGKVYIWNLDATLAGVIDVKNATKGTRRRDGRIRGFSEDRGWNTCVRDASWHPNAPIIVASAWNAYSMARGTCSIHSFNESVEAEEGEPRMGQSVDAMLEAKPETYFDSKYPH